MKTISASNVRKNISDLIDLVKETDEVIAISRHRNIEAVLIKFPSMYNKDVSDITNINANSKSFEFLRNEPEIYSLEDIKKWYV